MTSDEIAEIDIEYYEDRLRKRKSYPNGIELIYCWNSSYLDTTPFGDTKRTEKRYYYVYNPYKEKKYTRYETERDARYGIDCEMRWFYRMEYDEPPEKEDLIFEEALKAIGK
jgi:hypothetical protein